MTKDEALKLALEALKHTHPSALTSFYTIGDRDKAIKAIQEHLAQPEYQSTADKSKLEKVPAKGTLLAQPEQEPFAFLHPQKGFYFAKPTKITAPTIVDVEPLPLYTTPPQRKPLTDEEIKDKAEEAEFMVYEGRNYILSPSSDTDYDLSGELKRFARAIEAAHGIKGKA